MIDVVGFFNLVKASVPALKESKGTITAVSTMATERTVPADAASAVPKAAVNMIVKHVAREYARFGIRANIIGTGSASSPLMQKVAANNPMKRLGRSHELPDLAFF